MSDIFLFIIGVAVVFGLIVYMVAAGNHNRKVFIYRRIKESYGALPEREYSGADMESIPKYSKRIAGDRFYIDDITWDDLDMDKVFMLINQTVSACGEDYLYARLRIPRFTGSELDEDERLYRYFDEHPKERIRIACELYEIGKMKDISMVEHIYRIENVGKRSTLAYRICGIFSLLSLITLFVFPIVGIFMIVAAVIMAVRMHKKATEDEVESYMHSLSGVMRMITAAQRIMKHPDAELAGYYEQMKRDTEDLSALQRRSRLIVTRKGYGDILSGIVTGIISFFCVDLVAFYATIEEFMQKRETIGDLIDVLGRLDASISVASFRKYLPLYCLPEFTDGAVEIDVDNLYHPLLDNPVANSICMDGGTLITGSNASGKSTFIKSVAINTILAQTIHTSLATSYRSGYLKVMTSMSLADNVTTGESYYIVEVKSIKRILDEAVKGAPMLCIVDEVLRGTNTIERIAASSEILSRINKEHVIMLAATHDIELTYMLAGSFTNYHFDEEITDDDVIFNYLLKEGRTVSRNAIALLSVLGYPRDVIKNAGDKVKHFETTGKWPIEDAPDAGGAAVI